MALLHWAFSHRGPLGEADDGHVPAAVLIEEGLPEGGVAGLTCKHLGSPGDVAEVRLSV
jgi:hypothetical protein